MLLSWIENKVYLHCTGSRFIKFMIYSCALVSEHCSPFISNINHQWKHFAVYIYISLSESPSYNTRLLEKFADKVIYGKITAYFLGCLCFIKWLSNENKYAKNNMNLIFFKKGTAIITLHELDLRSTISYFHYVRWRLTTESQTCYFFNVNTFQFHTLFK